MTFPVHTRPLTTKRATPPMIDNLNFSNRSSLRFLSFTHWIMNGFNSCHNWWSLACWSFVIDLFSFKTALNESTKALRKSSSSMAIQFMLVPYFKSLGGKEWLGVVLVLLSFNTFGAELSIEQGKSTTWFADTRFYTPANYGAVSLRTDGTVYLEAIQGGWEGKNNSRFIGGSLGIRSSKKFFAEGSLGVVRLLTPRTTQLDGPNQFLVSVGLGVKIDNLIGSIRLRHFSNANTQGKNHGFEVKLFSIGVVF